MSEPVHHFGHCLDTGAGRDQWAVAQDHRQRQYAGGVKFGTGTGTTRVLGDKPLNAVGFQQRKVTVQREGTARDHRDGLGQRQRFGGRINQSQQVVMLRLCGEGRQVLPTDGQKDAGRFAGQGLHGGTYITHMGPAVTGPRRAFQRHQRHSGSGTGGDGVAAHSGGEGVGGVDDMCDSFGLQVADKAGYSTKTARALRDRLRCGTFGAAGVGIAGVQPGSDQGAGHFIGLGGAAKQKDAGHG